MAFYLAISGYLMGIPYLPNSDRGDLGDRVWNIKANG